MLEEIRITNYQRHRRLCVKFHKHVTTIVGSSMVGKSALVRALKWVCLNRPRGDGFVRHGAKFVGVSLFVDGHQVTRKRTAKTNMYALRSQSDEEGVVYNALGSDVPDDVAALLNVDGTNFQDQHDAPFWLSLSPGQVSRELNAVVDLGVIDDTLKNLASKVREAKTLVNVCTEQARSAQETLREFRDLPRQDADLTRIQGISGEWETSATQHNSLRLLITQVSVVGRERKRLKERALEARKLVSLGEIAKSAAERANQLGSLVVQYEGTKRRARPVDFGPVQRAHDVWNETQVKGQELLLMVGRIGTAEKLKRQAEQRHTETMETINRECGGVCPLCDQQLP